MTKPGSSQSSQKEGHLSEPAANSGQEGVSPASSSAAIQQPWLSLEPQDEPDLENVPDHQKAKAIKAAFFSPSPAGEASSSAVADSSAIGTGGSGAADADEEVAEHDAATYHSRPGGDIVSDIYNFVNEAESGPRGGRLTRSATFAGPDTHAHTSDDDSDATPSGYKDIMAPGGFRRNYLSQRQGYAADDDELERGSAHHSTTGNSSAAPRPPIRRHTKSFVDFLAHSSGVSHLYGQDLEEYEEDDEDLPAEISERTALLKAHMDYRKARQGGGDAPGDATVVQATLMLLKSFIGTGVLFLGKAFFNGGILFSSLTLTGIACVSLYSFVLLVKTRLAVPGGFGDIAGKLYGQWLRTIVLTSIAISQIGFVSAYFIFVAENLQAFWLSVTHCRQLLSLEWLIFGQLAIYIPLAMIRNIAKLSPTALLADAIILTGIAYIFGNEISVIAQHGISDVQLFNKNDFSLLLGTAVFAFEGIGLIIPITSSMREPEKFPATLSGVMIFLILLFVSSGVLAYSAYGSSVETIIFYNLPQHSKFVSAVQFMYSTAIVLSAPLQLFPAIRIIENGLFSRSGKFSNRVKWQKNTLRFLITTSCACIAYVARSDLDKFVSLIGSFACVPLSYNYPAMLHYRACAKTRKQKIIDIILFIFGTLTCLYCSIQTVTTLLQPGTEPKPGPRCSP